MTFFDIFQGKMYGVLSWQKFDKLWSHLGENRQGWYVWKCDEDMPTQTMSGDDFAKFLQDSEAFLRKQDRAKRCGFVYVDDVETPQFLKVFHPRKMGSGCGCSSQPVLPYWTISQIAPAPFVSRSTADAEHSSA